jgi:hypothetical protein
VKPARKKPPEPTPDDRLRRTIEAGLSVAHERRRLLDDLRAALEGGNDPLALALARRVVGLPPRIS